MFVTQLKSFFTVARLGSVTQAAKQLGLSQPTVTTQIKALEAHYGVALFRRQGGRLSLSDEGVQLLPQVDRLLQQEIQVEFALRESGELPRGHLRLGATAPYYVLDIVQRVRARHPQVSVSLGAGNSRQMVDALLAYQVDLATSSHLETDPRLHRVTLGADPLVLLLHREHALAARPTLQLADLAACDLILRERGSTTRQITEDALARAGVQARGVMEIASREAIREAVIRRMGVSVFARHEVSSHPDLVSRPLADELPSLVEYLYCLQERRESRLIAAFLAECRPATGPRG